MPDTAIAPTRPIRPVAATAGVLAVACMLVGTYVDTPWKKAGSQQWGIDLPGASGLAELLFVIAAAAIGLWVVFGVWLRRALTKPASAEAWQALWMALTGVVSIVVFWSGLPVLLGAAALYAALDSRSRAGRVLVPAAIAMVGGAVLIVSGVYLAFTG
jgi:hypothetical protein